MIIHKQCQDNWQANGKKIKSDSHCTPSVSISSCWIRDFQSKNEGTKYYKKRREHSMTKNLEAI